MDRVSMDSELIVKLLKIAMNCNELHKYMLLLPIYSISSRDPNGIERNALDYYSWEAIYRFARENPDFSLSEHIMDALLYNTHYKGERAIMATLSFIKYYCKKQETDEARLLELNVQLVLDEFRDTILNNKDMYMIGKQEFNEPFWNYILNDSKYLSEQFNLKLI